MDNRLKDKVAIVTGGATGIGEAISKKFALHGASVVVAGYGEDPVDAVVEEIKGKGGKAVAFKGDLSDEENARHCISHCIQTYGKLNILINNAGVFPDMDTLENYDIEVFDYMIRNNLRSAFLMIRYALPELQKTKGNIVSAGSEAGKIGIAQNAPYGGTKGFMHAFMRGIANEQAKHGIRANCVCPGPIDTAWTHKEQGPMDEQMEKTVKGATVMGRRGSTEEIANAYLFLASDEASYITGSLLSVDGGITISKGMIGEQVPDELRKEPAGELELKHEYQGATDMTR
ncbi:SDR family NAD(P)-dependent oxidoreductase [Roseivirga sp. BDSF3-8]|uniref:SDR family NAD(P)-dependent oxidoreductase n=1 Tax=Roseivirga sp. BDSF3-8 TaxID=3241598 RepID=UPI0035321950